MEPALKQRLIGAAVLVALAVIFLPMVIKGPAPESGASDVSMDMPEAPGGNFETRELPLVTPGSASEGGAVGMQVPPPATAPAAAPPAAPQGMLPPVAAGGNYAVTFGNYATSADADRVIAALRTAQLPASQDTVSAADGRTLHRVLIGPYATQAEGEAARLRAAHVSDKVVAKVIALDAGETATPSASTAQAVATPAAPVATPLPAEPTKPVAKPSPPVSAPAKPVATQPAAPPVSKPAPPKPVAAAPAPRPAAAASIGFAVQLGAFGNAAEANKLRDRARAAGFSAFVESVRTGQGTLSRVRVGPVSTRADADQLKAQVAARLGMSGLVQSHP
ncbi:SPOR domain-containing protein [Montanilutibacter psychrotolerans]|uniref:Sporulation protein n=1 Tax=Montanilutibacter psychrotolerans TaxID=1327343 RepID=A0A3M8SQQ9_9GAMM|nr:SPOR domain-containing protein [Lysobacter psychrotolerans]RNF81846.1 sporulation protein [Lysobacter psychrotolerans]